MSTPNPISLVTELTHRCPLHCPYCSNPLELTTRRDELSTQQWQNVLHQAADLGVLQLGLSGGEPLARRDLEQIVSTAAKVGLYSNLITGGSLLTAGRLERLLEAGLDHIQISLQDSDIASADMLAGARAHARKLHAAALAVSSGLPLTLNVVLHRHNIARLEEIVDMCVSVGAQRLELAHTQYYGWAAYNQAGLQPTREQVAFADEAFARARAKHANRIHILYVVADLYEELPKPCMGGWAKTTIVISPNGEAMPCHAAHALPNLTFDNVRDTRLADIWWRSAAFRRYRGSAWMEEPCRRCPMGRQDVDFGGCRCQAFRFTGNAAAADPVCRLSPHHHELAATREAGASLRLREQRSIKPSAVQQHL